MFNISPQVKEKLFRKHHVTLEEVYECFLDHNGPYIEETREKHLTWPPTEWFIGETLDGRLLKIVFIPEDDDTLTIKTAYPPSKKEKDIYAAQKQNW